MRAISVASMIRFDFLNAPSALVVQVAVKTSMVDFNRPGVFRREPGGQLAISRDVLCLAPC